MSVNVVMVLAIGVLFACGVFMLMERSLTRVLIGFLLLGNGANLLLLHMGGPSGAAPFVADGISVVEMSDPLPQALILTAIVITFGMTAFVLAMIYRSWRLSHVDTVTDDLDDRLVAGGVVGSEEETGADEDEMPTSEFDGRETR